MLSVAARKPATRAEQNPAAVATAHLPLRRAVSTLIHDTLTKSGARTNNELFLYRDFQASGLPPPRLHNELLLANDPETRRWLYDVLCTLWPRAVEYGLPGDAVGDLDALPQRLDDELDAANSPATCLGLVGDTAAQRIDGSARLIPTRIDQNPSAHWRRPMERMRHGWSMNSFQASQQWATMSS